MSSTELVTIIMSAVSGAFTLMLSAIIFLLKHSIDVERRLLMTAIDEAKAEAKAASARLAEEMEKRHEQENKITQLDGFRLAQKSDIKRLEDRDDNQESQITTLKERLDRGARSISQQMPSSRQLPREEPPSDPPLAAMRPRLPSRRGE